MLQLLPPTAIAVISRFKSLKSSFLIRVLGNSGAALRRDVQRICFQLKNCRQPDALEQ
jgi:hypothetical protein